MQVEREGESNREEQRKEKQSTLESNLMLDHIQRFKQQSTSNKLYINNNKNYKKNYHIKMRLRIILMYYNRS